MPIIKANGYGHGLEIIARAAVRSEEVDYFGVATEEEGAKLRRLTHLPILVLLLFRLVNPQALPSTSYPKRVYARKR